MSDLKAIIEALVFASPEPVTVKALVKLLDTETRDDIVAAIAGLRADYERPGGLQLVEVAGGYQIVTRPELHEWVRRLFHERTTQKLSVAALETLAVIAYKQPITAPEIADVRGVNAAGVVGTLIERKLVKIVGRKQVVGRPFLYGTTREFLERFGLNDLSDLPKVEDMSELLGFDLPASVGQPDPQTELPFDHRASGGLEPGGGGDVELDRNLEPGTDVEPEPGDPGTDAESDAVSDREPADSDQDDERDSDPKRGEAIH